MSLTPAGFKRPTYDDIVETISQESREKLGEDIDVSETSVYGKFIRIIAKSISNAYEALEMIYFARFPNSAQGTSLDRLSVFAGITRDPATYARHKIEVIGTNDTTIGMGGLIVSNDDGITFYNENDFTIGSDGTANVIVVATEAGTSGNVNDINKIVNPVAGIISISYIGLEEVAENIESDVNLRKRFSVSVAGSGSCTVDAIKGAVARLTGIDSVNIVTNDEDNTDANGRPGHSFELYVYGGVGIEQEIANTIFEKKPIGIKAISTADTEHSITKTVIDGGGYEHIISFSRVKEIKIDIAVRIKTNTAYTTDGDIAIKNSLVKYVDSLGVGNSVVTSAMYSTIFSVAGVTEILSVTQALEGQTKSTETLNFDLSQIPITTADNITVEIVDF